MFVNSIQIFYSYGMTYGLNDNCNLAECDKSKFLGLHVTNLLHTKKKKVIYSPNIHTLYQGDCHLLIVKYVTCYILLV